MIFSRFLDLPASSDGRRSTATRLGRLTRLSAVGLTAVVVAACGSVNDNPTAGQTVLGATAAPATVSAPVSAPVSGSVSSPMSGPVSSPGAAGSGSLGGGSQTTLDPCQLVPASEAGTVAGTTFSAGTEGTADNNARTCTYGTPTSTVFEVTVVQAPSAAAAQAAETAAITGIKAKAQTVPVQTTQVAGVGDSAVYASFSATAVNASGIFVLKGTVFFSLTEFAVGRPAATQSQLVTEAQTVIGRLG